MSAFWPTFEDLPGLAAPMAGTIGFEQIRKILRQTGELATSVNCPSPGGDGCPRRVVDHGSGRFVAVCGDSPRNCDDLTLTRADIIIHRIDVKELCRQIATALGLSAPATLGAADILHVGDFEPIKGKRFPVTLVLQTERNAPSL
ncbi:MAG: Uncharacterized protein FD149_2278 [Rhodospirillaceae bacterium]|nr:MAG: Uncharacterized protein FD149_2278 [Rhodospirillaceae bacterium]